jgi:hypothetical protein
VTIADDLHMAPCRIRVFRDRDMAAVLDGHTDYITALAAAPAADHTTQAIASVAGVHSCVQCEPYCVRSATIILA